MPGKPKPPAIQKTAEELAEEIAKLNRGMDALNNSRLRKTTVILLLSHYSKVSQRDVGLVLDALSNLERTYLK